MSWQTSPLAGIGCASCPDDGIGGTTIGVLIAAGRDNTDRTKYVGFRAEFEWTKAFHYQQRFRDGFISHGMYQDWSISGLLSLHPIHRAKIKPGLLIGLSVLNQKLTGRGAFEEQPMPRFTAGLTFGIDLPFQARSRWAIVPYARGHAINRNVSFSYPNLGLGSFQLRTGVAARVVFR